MRWDVFNFLVLQWFFIRLAPVVQRQEGGRLPPTQQVGWILMTWVVPCTGWWGPYRYLPWSNMVRRR